MLLKFPHGLTQHSFQGSHILPLGAQFSILDFNSGFQSGYDAVLLLILLLQTSDLIVEVLYSRLVSRALPFQSLMLACEVIQIVSNSLYLLVQALFVCLRLFGVILKLPYLLFEKILNQPEFVV